MFFLKGKTVHKKPESLRIKLLTSIAGHRFHPCGDVVGEYSYYAGQVIDWPEPEARRYIARGMAIEFTPDVEAAAREKAVIVAN